MQHRHIRLTRPRSSPSYVQFSVETLTRITQETPSDQRDNPDVSTADTTREAAKKATSGTSAAASPVRRTAPAANGTAAPPIPHHTHPTPRSSPSATPNRPHPSESRNFDADDAGSMSQIMARITLDIKADITDYPNSPSYRVVRPQVRPVYILLRDWCIVFI